MNWFGVIMIAAFFTGCSNQPAKPDDTREKPAATESTSKAVEEVPADPYAALEAERNAVKESLTGKVSELPSEPDAATRQKVYSGVVEIADKNGSHPVILLKTNRGTIVLVGEKSSGLQTDEGRFLTVIGRSIHGVPVPTDLRDLEQVDVEGVVRR